MGFICFFNVPFMTSWTLIFMFFHIAIQEKWINGLVLVEALFIVSDTTTITTTKSVITTSESSYDGSRNVWIIGGILIGLILLLGFMICVFLFQISCDKKSKQKVRLRN